MCRSSQVLYAFSPPTDLLEELGVDQFVHHNSFADLLADGWGKLSPAELFVCPYCWETAVVDSYSASDGDGSESEGLSRMRKKERYLYKRAHRRRASSSQAREGGETSEEDERTRLTPGTSPRASEGRAPRVHSSSASSSSSTSTATTSSTADQAYQSGNLRTLPASRASATQAPSTPRVLNTTNQPPLHGEPVFAIPEATPPDVAAPSTNVQTRRGALFVSKRSGKAGTARTPSFIPLRLKPAAKKAASSSSLDGQLVHDGQRVFPRARVTSGGRVPKGRQESSSYSDDSMIVNDDDDDDEEGEEESFASSSSSCGNLGSVDATILNPEFIERQKRKRARAQRKSHSAQSESAERHEGTRILKNPLRVLWEMTDREASWPSLLFSDLRSARKHIRTAHGGSGTGDVETIRDRIGLYLAQSNERLLAAHWFDIRRDQDSLTHTTTSFWSRSARYNVFLYNTILRVVKDASSDAVRTKFVPGGQDDAAVSSDELMLADNSSSNAEQGAQTRKQQKRKENNKKMQCAKSKKHARGKVLTDEEEGTAFTSDNSSSKGCGRQANARQKQKKSKQGKRNTQHQCGLNTQPTGGAGEHDRNTRSPDEHLTDDSNQEQRLQSRKHRKQITAREDVTKTQNGQRKHIRGKVLSDGGNGADATNPFMHQVINTRNADLGKQNECGESKSSRCQGVIDRAKGTGPFKKRRRMDVVLSDSDS
ncbi:hypothetical protein DIPPA_07538 [Diplonema papillatum]|nr:hypothetical protein DIPPA_07538 [Diplonema papillatum]